MGRAIIKWDKSVPMRPVNNIIASDFPKYVPQPWKYMEGESQMPLLLSYEYQRMWIQERDAWKERMYPADEAINTDVVQRYVLTFKTNVKRPKPEQKKLFRLKKFDNVRKQVSTKRPPDDKALAHQKERNETRQERVKI